MSLRLNAIRAFIPTICLFSVLSLAVEPSYSQQAPPVASPSQPEAQPVPQPTAQTPASQTLPTLPPASKEPDYPDPRSFTLAVYGLWSLSSGGPNIIGGAAATNINAYESLYAIGKPYSIIPQFEFSLPVTRTGTLYVDFERFHGWADQNLTKPTFVDSFNFVAGDSIHSTYHVITSRIYLDDLLYPHQFPVSRLRFKSIWGLRYMSFTQTVDSATEDAAAGLGGSSFQVGTNFIFFPEFGLAMEYALQPHVLFRVDGAGFGFPHHSNMEDTSATLSVRQKNLEFLAGIKMLHFKTSPQKEEYEEEYYVTPFVGIRWHW